MITEVYVIYVTGVPKYYSLKPSLAHTKARELRAAGEDASVYAMPEGFAKGKGLVEITVTSLVR